jgi:hypothetical protein
MAKPKRERAAPILAERISVYFSNRPYYFTWEFQWYDGAGNSGVLPIEADTLRDAMRVFYEIRDRVIAEGGRMEFAHVEHKVNAVQN